METVLKKHMIKQWKKLANNLTIVYKTMAQAHENQDAINRGEVQPPEGLNSNMTPEEYNKFFNHQRPSGSQGDRQMQQRYKPKGIDYKMYGDRYHRGSVLEDKERLVEYSRMTGITTANQIRGTNRPDLNANEGNFSNTFLSSG